MTSRAILNGWPLAAGQPSGATPTPTPTPLPSFTTQPSITGTPTVGQPLSSLTFNDGTVSNGTVSSRAYLLAGVSKALSYVLLSGDVGAALTYQATATGAGGSTTATSAPVAVAAAGADADTTAYIARMSVAPSTEQASAYDYFVTQAKAIGVWPYITDCGFLCAHDAQSAKLGLKNVINPANVGGGPGHIPGYGMQGNGTSTSLNTGYMFPAGLQNDASIGFYSLSSQDVNAGDCGNANTVITSRQPSTNAMFMRVNAVSSQQSVQLDPIGMIIANRTGAAATDQTVSRRGSAIAVGTAGGASATPDAVYPLWFCGRNGATPDYSARLLSFWHIGKGIPANLIAPYSALVEEVCVRLSASYTVIANLTAKTKALYKFMIRMGRQPAYLFGAFDNTDWAGARNLVADIAMITGKAPAFTTNEVMFDTGKGGVAARDRQIARIKAHYAAGGIVSLHHHTGNPVTGFLGVTSWDNGRGPTGTGSQADRNGSPIPACLAGGSKRAEYLAYIDQWIAFTQLCVDGNGEPIPLVLRPFHEGDQSYFWWSDNTNKSGSAQLRRDFVDRFKAAGITNVLFDQNFDAQTIADINFYAGSAYVDFTSGDYYNLNGSGVALTATNGIAQSMPQLRKLGTASIRKPWLISEMGYLDTGATTTGAWTTITGNIHRDYMSLSAGFAPWTVPYGPGVGDATQSDFAAMVAEASCITRDRLSGVYA